MALLDDASRLGRVASLARQGQSESCAAAAAADTACMEVRASYVLHTYATIFIKPCRPTAVAFGTSFFFASMLHWGWLAGKQRIVTLSSKPSHGNHSNAAAGGG